MVSAAKPDGFHQGGFTRKTRGASF